MTNLFRHSSEVTRWTAIGLCSKSQRVVAAVHHKDGAKNHLPASLRGYFPNGSGFRRRLLPRTLPCNFLD
jgi:hypothetical protein